MEDSILELFGKEGDVTEEDIQDLTDQDILDAINNQTTSGIFSIKKDFKAMLGKVFKCTSNSKPYEKLFERENTEF